MFKFSKMVNATSFADKCKKNQMIILGDDNKFWVISMAAGEKLLKQGYEIA